MAERLFDRLEQEAFRAGIQARTQQSMAWFRKRVSNIRVSRVALLAQGPQRARHSYGRMYNFQYDPKMKLTLPYYDRFPLCIPIQRAKGGFHGINLHYLHPVIRAQFLDALMAFSSDKSFTIGTKMRLTYNLLRGSAKLKWFKPCFKHYLTKHVSSNISKVSAAEWNIAIFLETAAFRKKTERFVWGRSRRQYR